ncbi:hypothetical protein HYPSUDRAFT_187536 [Hypholoma sublateritium FD-334 SS-4]|uniref:SHSP domain-containing protein n=1 Tax=Hypholoma sublateritium (strain FD-334 SS-4) TaxID=945553 RepID=A0A0D2NRB6_HYPSF|nr:hypothetical protein HYPSUDRAFT_187536 [Hypholoma sublateritium FD-334 SS-4]
MSNVFFYEPFYDLDRFIETLSGATQAQKGAARQQSSGEGVVRSYRPRLDLHENAEKNLVTASFEFPGVPKERIEIDVHNGKLTVSADIKQSVDIDEGGYAIRERRFGKYSRTLQLPQGVQDDEIKASMDNGVLTITFPRTTPDLAPKRVSIA